MKRQPLGSADPHHRTRAAEELTDAKHALREARAFARAGRCVPAIARLVDGSTYLGAGGAHGYAAKRAPIGALRALTTLQHSVMQEVTGACSGRRS